MNDFLVNKLSRALDEIQDTKYFMEVCGTHTNIIGKLGLRSFLGDKVKLISGPGCPVCVTPSKFIDYIYYLAINNKVSIITYGDMLRVPGSNPNINLLNAKALGADVNMVYSSVDSIKIAKENTDKEYVFLAIGFETTIASTCILLNEINNAKITNLKILSLHKKVEPVVRKLIHDKDIKIDGFLCPGNVAVVIGEKGFEYIKEENMIGVITGFSDDEIIKAIIQLINNSNSKKGILINEYKTFVSYEGNILAKEIIDLYFKEDRALWRGLGEINLSGYVLKDEFSKYDILKKYPLEEVLSQSKVEKVKYVCRCGDILKGKITPKECELFREVCTPDFPIGPCMVSSEGTCGTYYKYE